MNHFAQYRISKYLQQKPHSNISRKISSTDTRPISLLWEQNFHNRLQELILFYDHALQFPCHRMGLKFPRHCVGISLPCNDMGMKFPQNGMGMKFTQTICRNCILFIILPPGCQDPRKFRHRDSRKPVHWDTSTMGVVRVPTDRICVGIFLILKFSLWQKSQPRDKLLQILCANLLSEFLAILTKSY